MKMTPLYDRVLVKLYDEANRTVGGLFLPENRHPSVFGRGTVIAVGSGRVAFDGRVFPLQTKVGDVVMFARREAQAVPVDGEDDGTVVLIREPEIVGVLTDLPSASIRITPDATIVDLA